MEQTNWKAWLSVAVTTFAGGVTSYLALPHNDLHPKQIVICAALAGLSAVGHLFQQPKVVIEPPEEPKVDEPKDAP